MQRYYVPDHNWFESEVSLTNEDAHHIIRVMRQQVGDQLICNHPNGQAAMCTISEIDDKKVIVQVDEWLEADNELPINITIVQGLPKGNKLEMIFQKGTELGATAFQIFEADRSIAKWDTKKADNRYKRYHKIIKEASEQCHRNKMPELKQVDSLQNIIASSQGYEHILFGYEEEVNNKEAHTLGKALQQVNLGENILMVIGPEGGFSKEEVELLKANQATSVRLGKRILRTETAALYALASLSYHFEEMER